MEVWYPVRRSQKTGGLRVTEGRGTRVNTDRIYEGWVKQRHPAVRNQVLTSGVGGTRESWPGNQTGDLMVSGDAICLFGGHWFPF